MKTTNLTQEIADFHQDVMGHNQLTAESLLSILAPMNAKIENSVTLIDVI